MAGYIQLLALAVFLASCKGAVIDVKRDSHDIDQCDANAAVDNLFASNIYEKAKLGITERILNYPETGINKKKITCIKVIDMDTNGHGGYAYIDFGGVGATDVQIRLKSQWGQSLDFRVEIWANKD